MNATTELTKPETRAGLSQLHERNQFTKVVDDTGDFATLKEYAPQDATHNPSLIFKAAQLAEYQYLIEKAITDGRSAAMDRAGLIGRIVDDLLVLFGVEILKIVPGRVSTETDANLSFDRQGLVNKAHQFIDRYEKYGVTRDRILIKIASTWEGIRAAENLQKEGINCNMTLLFSLAQAVACAAAKARLISPFVGRILDWHKKATGKDYTAAEDPGVQSVKTIYAYYKKFGCQTEVMGASFRNAGEILELAGCDLLTISPNLLAELKKSMAPVDRKLSPQLAPAAELKRIDLDEKKFRWLVNEDAVSTAKTAVGIRPVNTDAYMF